MCEHLQFFSAISRGPIIGGLNPAILVKNLQIPQSHHTPFEVIYRTIYYTNPESTPKNQQITQSHKPIIGPIQRCDDSIPYTEWKDMVCGFCGTKWLCYNSCENLT